MSKNEKTIPMRINGADFLFIVMFAWLAIDRHPAWWLAVVAMIAAWFVPPKWRRVTIFKWRAKE
jgi:hypothetical protein